MNTSSMHPYSEMLTYNITTNPDKTVEVCYNKTISHGNALWIENSIETTLPTFVLQFSIILALNRILLFASESFNVPRIVPNVFTGFLLGPSALGSWNYFFKTIFPYYNMMPLETLGAVTLVYYAFMVGLEVDLKPMIKCYNMKAMVLAIGGIIFAAPFGVGLYYLVVTDMGRIDLSPETRDKHMRGAIFWGVTLTCSSEFPEIAKILSSLKLLLTENGQLALTASLYNDLFSWTLLLAVLTQFYYASSLALVIVFMVLLVSVCVVHPLIEWLNIILVSTTGSTRGRIRGGEDRSEFLESQVVFLLHLVLVIGLLSDGLGADSIIGAFFLGVIMPKGVLSNAVRDKVFDFVCVFMMPVFYLMIGERIKIQDIVLDTHWTTIVIVLVLAFMVKIVSTFAIAWLYQMPLMEGLSLALLVNTKGTMPMIVLYSARDRLELDNQTFGVMLLACLIMTAIAGPVLATLTKYLTASKVFGVQWKTMKGTRPDSPLRVLACVHTKRDANVIINLLKASSPSVRTPIQVLAVEMIKMTNRPASSLIVKAARKPAFNSSSSKLVDHFKRDNNNEEDNLNSFDDLRQAIFADKLRIVSHYKSMHKDILNLCNRRNVNLIITTLYKQPTYDDLGAGNATTRAVNIINRDSANKDETKVVLENLVKEAPCCLAIFVDREFGHKRSKEKRIAMFYVGGGDDREALSYAWRMIRNMEVQLMVVRLVWDNPDDEFDEMDREYLMGFVHQTMEMPRVKYLEKVVRDEKETVSVLNRVGNKGFDLYVVGRGEGRKMSLAQTVEPVLDEHALGPLGDTLADLNSAAETSILIFQRRAGGGGGGGGGGSRGGRGEESGKHERNVSASMQIFDSMMEHQMMFSHKKQGTLPMVFGTYVDDLH